MWRKAYLYRGYYKLERRYILPKLNEENGIEQIIIGCKMNYDYEGFVATCQ